MNLGDIYALIIFCPIIGFILLIRGLYILRNINNITSNYLFTPAYAPIKNKKVKDSIFLPRFRFMSLFNIRPVINEGIFKIGTPEDIIGKEKSISYFKKLARIYIVFSIILFMISGISLIYIIFI